MRYRDLLRPWLCTLAALLCLDAGLGEARAQSRTRVWTLALGTSVAALPVDEFVNPACGTNGGPPSTRLDGFDKFARCPREPLTGLHEVWFIYDDEWEYVARAQRDEHQIAQYSANSFYSQPIVTSLLIDDAGLVQGYRVVTDPRAPNDVRIRAYVLAGIFKSLFSAAPWVCADLPRDERDRPLDELLIKEACHSLDGERLNRLETRHRYKPGQDLRVSPRDIQTAEADFESVVILEVLRRAAIKDAACCRAFASP